VAAGSAVIVDDFHYAAAAVAGDMTDLVERWPAGTAQLVLLSRFDPPLRLHRLRMAGELCELRDRDLCFSLAESGDLLANFGVEVAAADLALLHERSEGWAAGAIAVIVRDERGSYPVHTSHHPVGAGAARGHVHPDEADRAWTASARRPRFHR
jgi:ATP/maltotriose-dependent transcriptional regulator MalT